MFAHLQNHTLYYETIRANEKSNGNSEYVVLFLHEALGSIGQWKDFPQKLCDQLGIDGIVYERQGHGLSSPFSIARTSTYLHEYALEELPQFIGQVVPDKKLILVGHSDGGTIALLFAHQYPEQVNAIITMAAHVINEPETIAGIQPAIDAYTAGKLDGLKKYHHNKTDALFFAWANIWRSAEFKSWNITNEIGNSFPGLFIQGADDQYGTPKQLELIFNQFPSDSDKALIPSCGHHPHLETSENVIQLISKYISRIFNH